MPLTLKYDEALFADVILSQARTVSEQVRDSYLVNPNPRRSVWFHAVPTRWSTWRVQTWDGNPDNADLLDEEDASVRDICASMEYLCSGIIRGIRVIDGGSTLVAENIVEAVVKQDPGHLTEETCDAIVQMLVYGAIPHK